MCYESVYGVKHPVLSIMLHAPQSVIVFVCTGVRLVLFSRVFAFVAVNIQWRGKELYRLVLLFSSNL